jgi:SAM-dependent methyltransferase
MALEGLPEGRKVRLLEIGGGTAGMTSYVLPGLPTDGMEYVFTDISPHFLRGAEQRFHDAGFMKYQTLDIEKDPETQGFAPHAYDVILASDVLHATNDLRSVLGNVQRLLASDGLFVLLEIDRPARWLDLVFGLTEGWWRCTDHELRPAYPLLSRSAWTHLLRETGFKDPIAISERNGPQEPSQAVFVSRGPTLAPQPTEKADLRPERTPGHWLLFADSGGTGTAIAERLGRRGDSCILLSRATGYKQVNDLQFQINPAEREDFQRLLRDLVRVCPSLHGVIHCWSLDASPPEKMRQQWAFTA